MADETMSQYFVDSSTYCAAHGFTAHREGECVACEREALERAVLSAAEEWRAVDREWDELRKGLTPDPNFAPWVVLLDRVRSAVDTLVRARGEAEKGSE